MMNKQIKATDNLLEDITEITATALVHVVKAQDEEIERLKAQRDQAVEALDDIINVPREGQKRTYAAQVQMIMAIACAATEDE